jgi:anti-sigma factor RsiW
MKKEVTNCGREHELISFLYGELNDVEAQTFQRHRRDCAQCSAELAAFSDVRESVTAWRNESLGAIASPANFANPVTNVAGATTTKQKAAPSAWSAIREFFNLSPLWLKGAVAFASVLFCLFAGLAVARLREKPPVIVNNSAQPPSPQELDALVQQGVQAELERRLRNSNNQQLKPQTAENLTPKTPVKRVANRSEVAANANQKARRPLSKNEREQLAADLRLTSGKNDSELDLLDDQINQ